MNMTIKTESPRLAVTPGEWYASNLLAATSTGFRQMDDIPNVMGAVKLDYRTVWGFPPYLQKRPSEANQGTSALNQEA